MRIHSGSRISRGELSQHWPVRQEYGEDEKAGLSDRIRGLEESTEIVVQKLGVMSWVRGIAFMRVCRYDTLVAFERRSKTTRTAAGERDGECYV